MEHNLSSRKNEKMDVVRNIHSVPADRFEQGEGYFGGQMLKEPVRIISAQVSNGSE